MTTDIRAEFPIFEHWPDLAYLDNAATAQKPRSVLRAELDVYAQKNAAVHRAVFPLAAEATEAYERARARVARFLNARRPSEIVFTSGATAGINLVAADLAQRLGPGDEVMVTAMEHHANLIPWQQACLRTGAKMVVVPMLRSGELDWAAFRAMLGPRVRMLACAHASNVLGTLNPVADMIQLAHRHGTPVLLDAAQSIVCEEVDVQELGADFLVFSGHKMFGPMGIGVLYGQETRLAELAPWQTGGGMVRDVSFERTIFAPPPQRFEAGTPNVAGAVGLAAAIDFIEKLGKKQLQTHNADLLAYATELLMRLSGIEMVGTAPEKTGIVSFVTESVHPHDLATILGERGVCVRAGHHCAQPVMDYFGLPGTVRASFAIYNSRGDIDRLVAGILEAQKLFQ